MAYKIAKTKKESLDQLTRLVETFEKSLAGLKSAGYNEMQLRTDFINPLLKTFGWDVDNEGLASQFLRNVIVEESIEVEGEGNARKNPDYTLLVQGLRKLFIEVKRITNEIEDSAKAAFQLRRYGWNANLGISMLTNFEKIIVYDCRYRPSLNDDPSTARYRIFHFTEFLKQFDELYLLLSFESISSGYLEAYFSNSEPDLTTFDDFFLQQIERWRIRLAEDILQSNQGMDNGDINFLIQRLLNRIIFLRICEDREIEKYETLKAIKNYDELKTLFEKSDDRYNSGLFDFIEDIFSLNINLSAETLIEIFNELYYPESPYDFSVVDPAILSQIYERYLGSKIEILPHASIAIVEEPEVAASDGVVPTPKIIVENIVKEALGHLLTGKSISQIMKFKIADICCGSGTFLISAYDFILERITLAAIEERVDDEELLVKSSKGAYALTLKAKQAILHNNLYGVDINPYAVEVTKFSLFLKLLENENAASINNYLTKYHKKVLPDLNDNIKTGNSLVDETYFKFNPKSINDDKLQFKIRPFTWEEEFAFLKETKGFDAIVGNPPYVRIQNMVKYQEDEIRYYQSEISGFLVAKTENFDKYFLFIQKACQLLNSNGILSYIVPNKFFIAKWGGALRGFISTQCSINRIIHFGVTQVFPGRSTYTAILILDKREREYFGFKRIKRPFTEFIAGSIDYVPYKNADYGDKPWIFVSMATEGVFNKIRAANTMPLKSIADIPVGLQTSADDKYIFEPLSETDTTYKFKRKGVGYEVEKGICQACLLDVSFTLFDTVSPNAQMIYPYNIVGGKAEVFSEDYFANNFPLAWAYLNNFKVELSKRKISGPKPHKWYQFGRSQSLTRFYNAPKLIWSVLSTQPGYAYDEKDIKITGGGNGPYYSLINKPGYSLFFILGILSHPIFEAMVKAGASEFRGEYYSHGKQFIENLPIKIIDPTDKIQQGQHDEIIELVRQLINTKHAYNQLYDAAKKSVLGRKIKFLSDRRIDIINQLYGIGRAEIDIVLKDEMFLTDLNGN